MGIVRLRDRHPCAWCVFVAGVSIMRVLVACEFSGIVREAFRRRGHDAWSCDLLPAEDGSEFHCQDNIRNVWLHNEIHHVTWDLMIAHPPCTHLSVSGARWFKNKMQ